MSGRVMNRVTGNFDCVGGQVYFNKVKSQITGEIESCDFEQPDGATLETLDKHWQNY